MSKVLGYDVQSQDGLLKDFLALENFEQAWQKVAAKKGSAGVDGETISTFGCNLRSNLLQLRNAVADCSYTPLPYQQVRIPKGRGKWREIGVPTVRDRIVQNALANVLSPRLNPLFSSASFAYRPNCSYLDAVHQVAKWRKQGYSWVLDADIASYFDSINHQRLLQVLRHLIQDWRILCLIKAWICVGVQTKRRLVRANCGIPQGAVISPLLANVYLDEFDQLMERYPYQLVRYADDFLVLGTSQSQIQEAYEMVTRILASMHLKLHPTKSHITSFERGFRFLGHGFLSDAIFPLESQSKSISNSGKSSRKTRKK